MVFMADTNELKETDIAEHALEALSKSQIKKVYLIGRRGPVQAAFTEPEIKEMGKLVASDVIVDAKDIELNEASQTELDDPDNKHSQKNFTVLKEYAERSLSGHEKQLIIRFFQSPVELTGDGVLEKVVLETNSLSGEAFKQKARGTGEKETLGANILFRSVGYRGIPMEGVPFNDSWGVFRTILNTLQCNNGPPCFRGEPSMSLS